MTAQPSLFAADEACGVCGRTQAGGARELRPDPHLGLVCEGCRQRVGFDGSDYRPALDDDRLRGQIRRVFDAMRPGRWLTLSEIRAITGDPEASISAQIRHLRKPRFGGWRIPKRHRGDPARGLYEYRLYLGERN